LATEEITVIPDERQLSILETANFLGVSRAYLRRLLNSGAIPYHGVGSDCRVLLADLAEYKRRIDSQRRHALDELTAQAQKLAMGYE
jgi:excisionase family DNA binding protein